MPEKYLDLTGLQTFLNKLDDRYVDKTSDQTITGAKSFSSSPRPSAADISLGTYNNRWGILYFNGTFNNGSQVYYLNPNTSGDILTTVGSQTITGTKTFSTGPILTNNIYLQGKKSNGTAYDLIGMRSDGVVKVGNGSSTLMLDTGSIVIPSGNGTKSLGSSSYKWKDLYLSGQLKDGNNSDYGLVLPDTTSYTVNRTIATVEELPQVLRFI